MRHRVAGRKLGRSPSHRKALMRTMVTDLLENERMITTLPKAKELRSVAEKMITLGKRESLHARRQALSFLRKKSVVHKLFDQLGPRYADREGGYTRILRLGFRRGDASEVALLELVEEEVNRKPKKRKKKKAAAAKVAPPAPAATEVEAVGEEVAEDTAEAGAEVTEAAGDPAGEAAEEAAGEAPVAEPVDDEADASAGPPEAEASAVEDEQEARPDEDEGAEAEAAEEEKKD